MGMGMDVLFLPGTHRAPPRVSLYSRCNSGHRGPKGPSRPRSSEGNISHSLTFCRSGKVQVHIPWAGMHWKGGRYRPPPSLGRPAYAQPLSP